MTGARSDNGAPIVPRKSIGKWIAQRFPFNRPDRKRDCKTYT